MRGKLKVGDRVTIIKYGRIYWHSRKEWDDHNMGKPLNIIEETEDLYMIDAKPEYIGLTGEVVGKINGKHFDYTFKSDEGNVVIPVREEQLKLIEETDGN